MPILNRKFGIYLLLFVIAYTVFLVAGLSGEWRVYSANVSSREKPQSSAREARWANNLASSENVARSVAESMQSRSPVANRAGQAESLPNDGASGDWVSREFSEETLAEINALSTQAASASEPAERFKAIVRLRNGVSTPQVLQALTGVVSHDQFARNRMLAITALHSLAGRGDSDGAIRLLLQRTAASDPDAKVVKLAQEAYESILQAHPES